MTRMALGLTSFPTREQLNQDEAPGPKITSLSANGCI
jgi:hypothetical protein